MFPVFSTYLKIINLINLSQQKPERYILGLESQIQTRFNIMLLAFTPV